MSSAAQIHALIESHAAGSFTDSTTLVDAGVVSLSIFRMIAELRPDPGAELDIEGLAHVHTVADLKRWLGAIAGASAQLGRVS
ncbi:hypothetical protein ACWEIJ_37600 [Lentzea sp. NPDC004789]